MEEDDLMHPLFISPDERQHRREGEKEREEEEDDDEHIPAVVSCAAVALVLHPSGSD